MDHRYTQINTDKINPKIKVNLAADERVYLWLKFPEVKS
jgi:hypothetical protein